MSEQQHMAANPRLFTFEAGNTGTWKITQIKTIIGAPWPTAARMSIHTGDSPTSSSPWTLRGATSNERYTTREEKSQLAARQLPLGRPDSTLGALIPIRKNDAWWALTQDERRAIFAEQHNFIGFKYLPAISRRLHHCRDLSTREPFDFLTFFDYSQENEAAFNDLLAALRATREWNFVDWEIDIRLSRE
jgi:hypothetical protein